MATHIQYKLMEYLQNPGARAYDEHAMLKECKAAFDENAVMALRTFILMHTMHETVMELFPEPVAAMWQQAVMRNYNKLKSLSAEDQKAHCMKVMSALPEYMSKEGF